MSQQVVQYLIEEMIFNHFSEHYLIGYVILLIVSSSISHVSFLNHPSFPFSTEHNLGNEIGDEEQVQISHETIGNMFSEGNNLVWNYLEETTLGLFPLDSGIRQFCVKAMLNKWFDRIVLLAILGNSLFLAADNPLDEKNEQVVITLLHSSHSPLARCSWSLISSSMLSFQSSL